jgi:hypothetical protein
VTYQELAVAMADKVKGYVRADRAALETRLAVCEAQLATLLARGPDESFTKELSTLRERVAVVEVRPPLPGPPGEPGPPGKDGKDGKAGLTYQGVYQEKNAYDPGDVVTWAGSMWHCNEFTTSKPGENTKGWTLMVKRGRDGKDGTK